MGYRLKKTILFCSLFAAKVVLAADVQFEVIPVPKGVYLRWDVPAALFDAEFRIYRQRTGKQERRLLTEKALRRAQTDEEIRKALGADLDILTGDNPSGDDEWNSRSKADREKEIFSIFRAYDPRFVVLSFVVPSLADAFAVQYTDFTAEKDGEYTYYLYAGAAGQERLLAQKKIKASNVPPVPVPKILEAKSENKRAVILWEKADAKSGIVGYNIYRNEFETGDFRKLNKYPILSVSMETKKGDKPLPVAYTDETVENEKEYWYRIRAYHAAGFESDWSEKIKVYPIDNTKPQPVSLLKAETGNDGSIVVRWKLSEEKAIAGYNVYRSESQNGDWKKINPFLIPVNVSWFEDNMEKVGTVMWYKVTVVNQKKIESPFSNSVFTKITRFSKPVQVKMLKTVSGAGYVDVFWEKSSDPHVAFYEIYRTHSKTEEAMPQTRLPKGTLTYRDLHVKPGNTYYYSVKVIDSYEKKSGLSDAITGAPIDNRPVFPPAGLTVRSFENSIIITWTPVYSDKNAGYFVYRRLSAPGNNFARIHDKMLEKNTTEYRDILSYGKGSYEYYVTTVSSDGEESKPSSIKTAAVWDVRPEEVRQLMVLPRSQATDNKKPAMTIQWQPMVASSVEGYKVYRMEVGGDSLQPIGFVKNTENNFIDYKIKAGTRYGYSVTAVDKRGNEGPFCPIEYNSFGEAVR